MWTLEWLQCSPWSSCWSTGQRIHGWLLPKVTFPYFKPQSSGGGRKHFLCLMRVSEWQTILQVCMCLVKTRIPTTEARTWALSGSPSTVLPLWSPGKEKAGVSCCQKQLSKPLKISWVSDRILRTLGPTQSTFNLIKRCFSFFGVKTKTPLDLPHGLIQRLGPAVWTQISTTHASLQNSSMDLDFVQEESQDPRNLSF